MIFKRLFKPKWLREQGATAASGEDPAGPLAEQAVGDRDPGARRRACKAISDPELLQRVSAEDGDAGVRDIAAARLRNLLAGGEPESLDLQVRLAHLRQSPDPLLAAHLAIHGREPELRRSALEAVSDPRILAECAVHDSVASVRLAAAERLDEKAALERVSRQIGKKDKNVYRQVRRKLKEIAEREQAPARLRAEAEGVCERVEKLGRGNTWIQDKALWDHLEKRWAELDQEDIPAELVQRHRRAREGFLAGYRTYREANLERVREQEALERLQRDKLALLQELRALTPGDDIAVTEALSAGLKSRWEALGPLPDSREARLQREFAAALGDLEDAIGQRHKLQQRGARLVRLQQRAESWLERSAPLQCAQVRQWLDEGRHLVEMQPDDGTSQQFNRIRERLQDRLEKQTAHAGEKLERLSGRLDLLQRELEEGVLKKATALHQSIHADLTLIDSSGIARHRVKELERRYRSITPRLRELQNWRKWGTDQQREELCSNMEQLATAELPLEELTERVQTLQDQWKRLDRGGSRVNETLWQRFHQAADRTYERCRPFLERQAEERAANRKVREELCSRLEAFLEQVDWERMDWKKAVHAEREMRAAWGRIGPVEPRHRRGLERRFRAAMKRLGAHLAEERTRNQALKRELIAQAEALVEEPDLEQAIQKIKRLQRQWHTTVAAKRKQENSLWQRFRSACDQVFERRHGVRQSQRAELEAHARERRDLCEELEALATAPGEDPDGLSHRLHELQGRWDAEQAPGLSRQEAAPLERRWQEGVNRVQQRVRQLRREAEREQLERLRARAGLCRELEAAAETGAAGPATTDNWRQRWNALPRPDDEAARQGMERRFQAALDALEEGGAALETWRSGLTVNQRERAELCLRLEVLAGIDSPEEAARERLAFQVSRLSGHLSQGESDLLDHAPRLQQAWCLCGAAPAVEMERLEARFLRAEQALEGQRSRSEPTTAEEQ